MKGSEAFARQCLAALFDAQGGLCCHCGTPMQQRQSRGSSGPPPEMSWTKDHIIPLSRGGDGLPHNVLLAHLACNGLRGNADPSQALLDLCCEVYRALGLIAFTLTEDEPRTARAQRRSFGQLPRVTLADIWPKAP